MENRLHRFWITFHDAPGFFPLGFGVTAESAEEAMDFVKTTLQGWWPDQPMPTRARIMEDVDVSELQQDLPLSHFGIPCNLGVWYPRVNIGSFYPPNV